jgi:hypothetical protein
MLARHITQLAVAILPFLFSPALAQPKAEDAPKRQTGWSGFFVNGSPRGQAGSIVVVVDPGTPAAQAGLHVRDVILNYDSKQVEHWWDVYTWGRSKQPGDVVPIVVLRNKRPVSLNVQLSVPPADSAFITSVVQTWIGGGPQFVISGGNFGAVKAYAGGGQPLYLSELNQNWIAGADSAPAGLIVNSWYPNEITIGGLFAHRHDLRALKGDVLMAVLCNTANPGCRSKGAGRAVATVTLNDSFVVKLPPPLPRTGDGMAILGALTLLGAVALVIGLIFRSSGGSHIPSTSHNLNLNMAHNLDPAASEAAMLGQLQHRQELLTEMRQHPVPPNFS